MGRKKKRARKQHLFDDLLLPVAGLFLVYLVVKNGFNASLSQITTNNLFGVWGISGVVVIITSLLLVGFLLYTLSRYIDRRNRARMVREQKYINEWFSMTPEKFEHFVA